jgi:hypothetical protein
VTTELDGITLVLADRRGDAGPGLDLGICGTSVAYILYYLLVEKLGAVAASGMTYVPPVVALLIGALWVGEPVWPSDVAAMAAILLGAGVLQSGRSAGTAGSNPAGRRLPAQRGDSN